MSKSFDELSPALKIGVQSAEGWDGENYHIKTEDGVVVLGMAEEKGAPVYTVAGEKKTTPKVEDKTPADETTDNSKLTVAEIKEALTGLGIDIPAGANKAELVVLLDEAQAATK